ncbi:MAG: SAM-dependent methyltransferase, partial [Oscillospiraceae bacterium]
DKRTARHETMCTIEDVCHTASRLLKDGGRLCVCQRPLRLADVICAMRNERIEPKVLRFVQQRESSENPWLFLLQGQKNRASGLTMQKSFIVENDKGDFSDEIKAIYGIKY